MRNTLALLAVAAAIAATIAAAQPQSTWKAPAGADKRTNPLVARPEATEGGRKLFAQRCAVCHGDDATGTRHGPNLTAGPVQRQSDGALFWKITSGNTHSGMPSFSFLPEPQRWQLVNQLRAQSGR
jgi:mono/diheme cytochrome c family protein